MNMEIGDKIELWFHKLTPSSYIDQIGCKHECLELLPENRRQVTITEKFVVPASYPDGVTYYGYRGKDSEERIYECNSHSFPNDSSTPYHLWGGVHNNKVCLFYYYQYYHHFMMPLIQRESDGSISKARPVGTVICPNCSLFVKEAEPCSICAYVNRWNTLKNKIS